MEDKIVSWLTIGGSDNQRRSERRNVGWKFDEYGWSGWIERKILPQLEWFKANDLRPRFVLHNPFGILPGVMQFDQYLEAKWGVKGEHGRLPWLYEDFISAWKPFKLANKNAEVVCYLGKIQDDPQFTRSTPAQWINRFRACTHHALHSGMSIGFDASSSIAEDSPEFQGIRLLRSLGVKCYVEARPKANCPHLFDMPVVCDNKFWHRSNPEIFADSARWAAKNSDLTGEIMRLSFGDWRRSDWQKADANAITADGHSVAGPVDHYMRLGLTAKDLIV